MSRLVKTSCSIVLLAFKSEQLVLKLLGRFEVLHLRLHLIDPLK